MRRIAARAFVVTAPLPPTLFFPHTVVPEPGQVIEAAAGVFWLRMPLPFALDHINLWLLADRIDGVEGWTAIDCGFGNAVTRDLWESHLARNLRGLPLLRVVATHYHPDHLGNAAWLLARCRGDPLLWTTQAEFQTAHLVWNQLTQFRMADSAAFFRRHGMPEAAAEHHAARGNLYKAGVPELPQRYRRIHAGDTLIINPGEACGWLAGGSVYGCTTKAPTADPTGSFPLACGAPEIIAGCP